MAYVFSETEMAYVFPETDIQIHHTNTIKMAYGYAETDLQIYVPDETDSQIENAALSNDWNNVRGLFDATPELKIKPVNERLETPLMIAVGTNSSHDFVQQLLNNVTPFDHDSIKWCGVNNSGENVLHYAAQVGNMKDARLMAGCLPIWRLSWVRNSIGYTPVRLAARRGRKDMIDEVFLTYVFAETDLQIYKAALSNDWNNVRGLFDATPELKIKPVNELLETPLMIAVGTNSSHDFVKQLLSNVVRFDYHESVIQVMNAVTPLEFDRDKWCGVNKSGNNVLHYVAQVGNVEDARLMKGCLPFEMMSLVKNSSGYTPLLLAAKLGRKDMIDEFFIKDMTYELFMHFIYEIIRKEKENLVITAIQTGLLDLAVEILYWSRNLDGITSNPLEALATKQEFFPSGNRLGFWGRLIYQWTMPIIGNEILEQVTAQEFIEKLRTRLEELRPAFKYAKTWAPALKNIQDIKKNNEMSNAIMKYLCKIAIEKKDHEHVLKVFGSAIAEAVKYGIYELIKECLVAYPGIIWYEYEGFSLLHLAIKERQVEVYNLVHQISGYMAFAGSELHGKENALHIAAKLAPPHRLSTIAGEALQLQSELQWYKEVETFVEPEHVTALNKDGKTPWMVFKDEHKSLLNKGQQWMKDTATSSTVVAALLVTITFAAAITPPGGYKDDGKPVFLKERAFMLFMISDAIALFSSSTSLLMFLGILTSRYAEIDFLHALPKRLAIGLVSLFLSIAATMIAFGATLALLLHDKVTWIAAPVVLLTSIPVGLYVLLQFRLLIEIVWSTYGPSMFRKQSSRLIY